MLLLPINYGFLCALCAGNPDRSAVRATTFRAGLMSSLRLVALHAGSYSEVGEHGPEPHHCVGDD